MEIATLQAALSEAGIAPKGLKTLHETVIALDPSLDRPETEVEAAFPVYVLPVALKKILPVWETLHESLPALGMYPVILGDDDGLWMHYHQWKDAQSPPDVLKEAEQIDVGAWLDPHRDSALHFDDEHDDELILWKWKHLPISPEADLKRALRNLLFYKPKPIQYLGFVGTSRSWEVPAYLAFGDWNACPRPAKHVAIQRYWYALYQQELVGVQFDTLVCKPAALLTDKDEALALAAEQVIYCDDIVVQGVGTVKKLAAQLITYQGWFFWWD